MNVILRQQLAAENSRTRIQGLGGSIVDISQGPLGPTFIPMPTTNRFPPPPPPQPAHQDPQPFNFDQPGSFPNERPGVNISSRPEDKHITLAMSDTRSTHSAPDRREMGEIRRQITALIDGLDAIVASREEDEPVLKTTLQDLIQKCKNVYKKYMNPSYKPVQVRPDELDQLIKDAVRIPWEHAERLESTDIEILSAENDVILRISNGSYTAKEIELQQVPE
ncbi:hypothetical protein MMC07_000987 [Pseudocyphellaria aurata]|nr:hypothetical protein [Pseudocyphellaria aurata]